MDNILDDLRGCGQGVSTIPKCVHHVLDICSVLINMIYQLVLVGGVGAIRRGWWLVDRLGRLGTG